MAKKSLNVKNLAERYSLSAKEVLAELDAQGFHGLKSFSSIPADSEELILAYFDDLTSKKKGNGAPAAAVAGPEVHIKAPIIVKALAEALGKKPNEVITGLMMMNVLANINQMIEPAVAVELAAKRATAVASARTARNTVCSFFMLSPPCLSLGYYTPWRRIRQTKISGACAAPEIMD